MTTNIISMKRTEFQCVGHQTQPQTCCVTSLKYTVLSSHIETFEPDVVVCPTLRIDCAQIATAFQYVVE
jgi:hypothetical protein